MERQGIILHNIHRNRAKTMSGDIRTALLLCGGIICAIIALLLQSREFNMPWFAIGNPLIMALAEKDESEPLVIETLDPMRISFLPVQNNATMPQLTHTTLPRILIYHTHATEAYMQTETYTYEPSGSWRTKEASKSVIAVGAALAKALHDVYGIEVIHDTTNHEPPKLSTAYSRSLETMIEYQQEFSSIDIFIDVHRDAYGTDKKQVKDFVVIDGAESARLMFVVGTGKGATGTGFSEMPDFESNYALAKAITDRIASYDTRLVREVRVKEGRYNQHVSSQCLLVEVGHNANSQNQALAAVPRLAEAIAACIDTIPAEAIENADGTVWIPSA